MVIQMKYFNIKQMEILIVNAVLNKLVINEKGML